MIGCRDVAREHDLVMQTHVGEAKYQAASSFTIFGISMIEDDGLVRALSGPGSPRRMPSGSTTTDMACLPRGAQVAHNPAANLRLGSGIAPVARLSAPRRYCRHRHRRLASLRQSEHVRGDAGSLPSCRASAACHRPGMALDRRSLHLATEGSGAGAGLAGLSSARSPRATKPTSCCSTSTMSISCRSTMPSTRLCSPRTAMRRRQGVDWRKLVVVSGGRAIGIDRPRSQQRRMQRWSACRAQRRRAALRRTIEPIVPNFCRGLADDDMMHRLCRDLGRPDARCVYCGKPPHG